MRGHARITALTDAGILAEIERCFALLTVPGERWVQSDPDACAARHRPFSTFKP